MGPNALGFSSSDREDVQIEEEIQINVKKKSNKSINNYVIKFTKN